MFVGEKFRHVREKFGKLQTSTGLVLFIVLFSLPAYTVATSTTRVMLTQSDRIAHSVKDRFSLRSNL
jgi:hypothetical protein